LTCTTSCAEETE